MTTSELTDNELLMQFAKRRDEAAFREIVERHGPLVMSVGRLVVRQEQDAEDVFQATFLVLATRAKSMLEITSLAGWLQKVAYRTAVRAAKKRSRHAAVDLTDECAASDDPFKDISARETSQLLHEELHRLRPRYRNVIVLCDLEGQSRAAAARKLDCTIAAVQSILSRARRQLRIRLLGRGVALTVTIAAAGRHVLSAKSAVAQQLIENTVAACTAKSLAATALTCSKSAQVLASKGSQMMMISSLAKPLPAAILTVLFVAAPIIALASLPAEGDSGPGESAASSGATIQVADEADTIGQDPNFFKAQPPEAAVGDGAVLDDANSTAPATEPRRTAPPAAAAQSPTDAVPDVASGARNHAGTALAPIRYDDALLSVNQSLQQQFIAASTKLATLLSDDQLRTEITRTQQLIEARAADRRLEQATGTLEQLISEHPDSEAARKAKAAIELLRGKLGQPLHPTSESPQAEFLRRQ